MHDNGEKKKNEGGKGFLGKENRENKEPDCNKQLKEKLYEEFHG